MARMKKIDAVAAVVEATGLAQSVAETLKMTDLEKLIRTANAEQTEAPTTQAKAELVSIDGAVWHTDANGKRLGYVAPMRDRDGRDCFGYVPTNASGANKGTSDKNALGIKQARKVNPAFAAFLAQPEVQSLLNA